MNEWVNDIHQGHVIDQLSDLPESSVHCVMTSPPYYGLRNYGDETMTIWGGDDDCAHAWEERDVYQESPIRKGGPSEGHETTTKSERWRTTGRCVECGARREQLGLEEERSDYIEDLVEVGREIRRVLRPDGSWWLNLGDSFASSWGAQSKTDEANHRDRDAYPAKTPARHTSLPRKSKMLMPHRVAIALQDDDWVVRSDAVWAKPNPMPHPVKDRLNEQKEYLFHLAPNPDYYFDMDAIREPYAESSLNRVNQNNGNTVHNHSDQGHPNGEQRLDPNQFVHPGGKNPGDVLEVTVKPFPDAHFAVFPPKLCEIPIKSTCPDTVCADCGTPWQRVVDREPGEYDYTDRMDEMGEFGRAQASGTVKKPPQATMEGWEQQCGCDTDETEPGIVLDPFAGSGTTCLVAKSLGRRFVGTELNPDYVAMAQARVGIDVDEPERLHDDGQTTLAAADGGTEVSD